MRKMLVFALGLLTLGAPSVLAQTPYVAIFFDEDLQQTGRTPPGPAVIDTLFIVAGNFNMFASSIEYRVEQNLDYLLFLVDLTDFGTVEGSAYSGIRIHYDPPLDATADVLVERIIVMWVWEGMCRFANVPLRIFPHPESGEIQAIRWPDLVPVEAVGRLAYICPTVPVEETTWGSIKELYGR